MFLSSTAKLICYYSGGIVYTLLFVDTNNVTSPILTLNLEQKAEP